MSQQRASSSQSLDGSDRGAYSASPPLVAYQPAIFRGYTRQNPAVSAIFDKTQPSAHMGAETLDLGFQVAASSNQRLSAVISGWLQAGKSLVTRGLQNLHINMSLFGFLPMMPSRNVACPVDGRSH